MPIQSLETDRRRLLLGTAALGLPLGLGAPVQARQADLPNIQAVLDGFVDQGRLPGLTVGLQTRHGPPRYAQAGHVDFASPARVNADSLCRIYSMTKLMTGASTALLIQDGRLNLDQPVSDFLPELAHPTVFVRDYRHQITDTARRSITIRHLLTHTAGFAGEGSKTGRIYGLYRQAGLTPGHLEAPSTLDEWVARLATLPLQSQPGTLYDYGPSLDVLGLVIQRASGQPLPDFIQSRLLNPLGMTDTSWQLRPGQGNRLMALYTYAEDQTPERLEHASAEALSQPVSLYLGGSGLISSARDYLKFMSLLLTDGQLLNGGLGLMTPQTAQLIRSDILPQGLNALGGGHGFGGWVARADHRRAGEFGWSGTASTQAWIDPAKGFAAVLMMQALPYRSVDVLTPLRAAIDQDLGISRA